MRNVREDKVLKKAIKELPEYTPSAEAWESIVSDLNQGAVLSGKKTNSRLRYAAVIALVVSAGLIWYTTTSHNSNISFGEELSELNQKMAQAVDSEFEIFLDDECTEQRNVCEMPEFKMLMSELTAVEGEVTNIAVMIETTGYDKFLYKAKAKADQETVRIKKELVKLLRG